MLIRLDSLVGTKEAARTLPTLIANLRGDVSRPQYVITHRGEPVAVLCTLERYQELLSAAGKGAA